MAYSPPPLAGLRVLEFAGLAPGPFAGLLLADYGATVIRIDRAHPASHHTTTSTPAPSTADLLTRRKTSIAVDLKSARGVALVHALIPTADILIDPFRPGVLEKCNLAPSYLLKLNPRLIIARLTGFRRDGPYAAMAGHDINYIAVSGVLGMLGRKATKPYAPGNIVADFAGGGLTAFAGILLALVERERNGGRGQVVEANMVDGSAFLASFPRLMAATPMWDRPRGENVLDGGCPWYDTYETRDGKYVAVGALEPQFFAALCAGLGVDPGAFPGPREDRRVWPHLRMLFTAKFRSRTREEWERVFDGTDACVTPVLEQAELRERGFDQRPVVTLRDSPGWAVADGEADGRPAAEGQGIGVEGSGWVDKGLGPGEGGEEMLARLMGWRRGVHYDVEGGGLVLLKTQGRGYKL
ncbi:Alpha-methylacyl- racemase [Neofusicoccum parvum]|nr:Alpha-methylacyl- racemase [Neofusicoccum parvum]